MMRSNNKENIGQYKTESSLCGTTTLHRLTIIMTWVVLGIGSAWADEAVSASHSKGTKEQTVPWVRVFDREIEGVYMPARSFQAGQPIAPESVIVATYNHRESLSNKLNVFHMKDKPLILLSNFSTGKTGKPGYFFNTNRSLLENKGSRYHAFPKKMSAAVEKDLSRKLEACSAQRPSDVGAGQFLLFVTKDFKQSQCLVDTSTSYYQWLTSSAKPGQQTIHTLAIGIEPDSVRGQGGVRSYLNLETNKLFGCGDYGAPLCYWRKDIAGQEERDEYFFRNHTMWQRQYLIKTKGFRYCRNAWCLIDEPARLGPILNDGTALMWGTVSAMRVRLEDGSTNALTSQVKVVDAVNIRRLLDQHGAQNCQGDYIAAGNCQLTTMQAKPLPADWREEDYYPLVVEAVDTILQKLFHPEQNARETFK